MLIAFDGIDCTGKSTQIKLLKNYLELQGRAVLVVKEPGGTELGAEIRKLLLEREDNSPLAELALYLADRAENVAKNIKPWLDKNNPAEDKYVVIVDRFKDSTVAYQSHGKETVSEEMAEYLNMIFGPIDADLTFILDMPIPLMQERLAIRGGLDHFEKRGPEFFQKLQNYYQSLDHLENYKYISVGKKTIEQVHEEIIAQLP